MPARADPQPGHGPRTRSNRCCAGALGADRIVWLGQGLLEDADTDGHVDNICAFIEPGRALLQTVDEDDPNWDNTRENVRRLAEAGVETVEFELLPRIERDDGESVVVPYMNFYIANGALIVPIGGVDPDMDEEALGRLVRPLSRVAKWSASTRGSSPSAVAASTA